MRIAIVNDLLIAIEALRRVIASVPAYEIAWIARTGQEAVAKAIADSPDLILMDLVMPDMGGVEATRHIMRQSPCAILLVTATVTGHGSMVFEAMGYGALDVVNTPVLGTHQTAGGGTELLAKIAMIGKLISKGPDRRLLQQSVDPKPGVGPLPFLAVIGASTGGPQALKTIFTQLSSRFTGAIAVVQHVDAQFAPGLVEWLNQHSTIPIQLATAGCRLTPGQIVFAGTDQHLILQPNLTLAYTPEPQQSFYHPSVDVFFKSVAAYWPQPGVGVLLTGMGRDGAQGLMALRTAGWQTLAQNQESCVVYGMPKAAIELGAAIKTLPIDAIATTLAKSYYR